MSDTLANPTEPAAVLGLRERLLDAAEKIVERDGVSKLTLDAVAREAGVSKGGFLYHFPTKSALIIAVVERHACACDADQMKAMNASDKTPGSFTRAYLIARATPIDPSEEPIHTALIAAAGTDPQYLEPFRKRFACWQKLLEDDGIDPAVAMIVRLAMDGFCLGALLGMPVPTGELRQRILQKLLDLTHEDSLGADAPRDAISNEAISGEAMSGEVATEKVATH